MSFLNPREIEGSPLSGSASRGLVIGRLLAERLQVSPGRRVVISAQDVHGNIAEIGIEVVGLYQGQPDLQKYVAFAPLAQTQRFLGLGDSISEIGVYCQGQ